VQFYSNGASLGSAVALSASGRAATSALNFSTPGTYQITAVYSGDGTFSGSTSAALALVVTEPSSFTVTPAVTALSLNTGASVTDSVTISSVNGFAGTVALSCSVTGGGTASEPVCSLSPASVAVAAGGKVTAVATVSSTAQPAVRADNSHGAAVGGAMFACLLCLIPFRRRRAIRALTALVVMFGGLAAISGCGSGGSLATAASGSAGTYTVTVTGTGAAAGSSSAVTASTSFTLTVN
jgi:hypothetical protein